MEKRRKFLFFIGVTLLLGVAGTVLFFGFANINHWRVTESNKMLIESEKNTNVKKSFVLLQKAVLLNPTEKLQLLAGKKALMAGYNEVAISYFKKIKTEDGFKELCEAYYKSDQYQNAKKTYKQALTKKMNNKSYLCLGKVYLKEAKTTEAKEYFTQALSSTKDQEANYFKDLATLALSNNILLDFDSQNQRRDELGKITQPAAVFTRTNNFYQYLKDNNYPQLAFVVLKGGLELKQLDRDGYLLLANEYYLRKDYNKSYQLLMTAKEIDPYYPQTYQHLIDVAKLLNKKEDSLQFQKTLKTIAW